MGMLGIAGICGRKKIKTTRRVPSHQRAADLVERDFSGDAPDELWLTDVTYIATNEGRLYLCSILDVFSRRSLGWSMPDHLRTELCTDALDAAAMVRGRHRFLGTVLHSAHGCQYTSAEFNQRCAAMDIVQSMGTVGDSYDNSMMESAWSSLKRELVYETHFLTKDEARRAVSNGSFGTIVNDVTVPLTTRHRWSSGSFGTIKTLREGCPVCRGKATHHHINKC